MMLIAAAGFAHVDSPLLTDSCGSCHVGHGQSGQPMLAMAEEDFCYQCHGSDSERARMVAEGRLVPGARLQDMRPEFNKAFSHPVSQTGEHRPGEVIPTLSGGKTDHAECVDCHNPHQRIAAGKSMVQNVSGFTLAGVHLETGAREFQICLKCHTDRVGTGDSNRSLVRAFAGTARSQHPVTMPSPGLNLPSLRNPPLQAGFMKCSDCHRSDDPGAPKGPHGSDHESMLAGNYDRNVYTRESPFAFEFCYSCHDRLSILGNESFPYHREHIEGDLVSGRQGTSCYSCHASHGSPDNEHLILFNPSAVTGERTGRGVQYQSTGARSGQCYLECHGHNHNPGEYR